MQESIQKPCLLQTEDRIDLLSLTHDLPHELIVPLR